MNLADDDGGTRPRRWRISIYQVHCTIDAHELAKQRHSRDERFSPLGAGLRGAHHRVVKDTELRANWWVVNRRTLWQWLNVVEEVKGEECVYLFYYLLRIPPKNI